MVPKPRVLERPGLEHPDLPLLDGCQQMYVLPAGFTPRQALPGGIKWPNYNTIRNTLPTYDDMDIAHDPRGEADYDGFMYGQPGYPGGVPALPAGHSLTFGVTDLHGSEWWLEEAIGVSDSADWEQVAVTPGTEDGDWILGVRAKARDMTLKGTVIGATRESTAKSLAEGGSVLSALPRTGWLHWHDPNGFNRKIPVSMGGQFKTNWRGTQRVKVEVQLLGVNIGSPGKGVFWEAESPREYDFEEEVFQDFITGFGTVPTPVHLELSGLIPDDFSLQVNNYQITLNEPVPEGSMLVIDTATHTVTLDGEYARFMVNFRDDRWPVISIGAAPVELQWTKRDPIVGKPDPSVMMTVTDLW